MTTVVTVDVQDKQR